MSASIYLHSEFDRPRFSTESDQPCIWIRSEYANVTLTLDAADRAKLRAALDELDAREVAA